MTTRDLTSGMLTGIQAGAVSPILFFEGEYTDSGSVAYLRRWTGIGTLSWDGKTWLGAGDLMALSPLEETVETKGTGFVVTLSGLPTENIALALESTRRNASGKLWLGLLDSSGNLIADPYLLKRGRFSSIPVDDDGNTATLQVTYEDLLSAMQQPRELRYDSHSQALRDPDDLGFEYVEAIQNAIFDFTKYYPAI